MAMRKGIVSTTFGCEGIDVAHDRHVLLADSPTDFAGACLRLLADREKKARLGLAARQFVRERFDWQVITPLISRVYESLE
jgi:polysaccharide biosynthesis protein PslH